MPFESGFSERNGSVLTCLEIGRPVVASTPEFGAVLDPWLADQCRRGTLSFVRNDDDPASVAKIIFDVSQSSHEDQPRVAVQRWEAIAAAHLSLYERVAVH